MWSLFLSTVWFRLLQILPIINSELFVRLESCKREMRPGNWCEWGTWSSCIRSSCTRYRRRLCECPAPQKWTPENQCVAVRPQNDYMNGSKLVLQTRYIRETISGEQCEIPTFMSGKFYPDCIPYSELSDEDQQTVRSTHSACRSHGEFRSCEQDEEGDLRIAGMQEYDVGACDGWGRSLHRRSTAASTDRFTYGADSELGQQCTFSADDQVNQCPQHHFFGPTSASDYGRLTSLAYDIDSCRFACAIRRTCRVMEFIKGVECSLIAERAPLADEHYLGAIVETKPDTCDEPVAEPYPYALAVSLLENKHGGE